jgi:alpha-L-fucosidase 2
MKRALFPTLAACIATVSAAAPLELRYDQPAKAWENGALPVGNGRIGAMIFGDPSKERIQFNDITLWTGGENVSGGYDAEEFGSYQNFGDLFIETGSAASSQSPVTVACTSGQKPFYDAEGPGASGDGNLGTKWCVEHGGKDVIWQADYEKPEAIARYVFVSASDVPDRDPGTWRFEGSLDGSTWKTLHEMKDQAPFAKRGETKSFDSKNTTAYKHYRIVFGPTKVPHLQIAEIALGNLGGTASPDGYVRALDLGTGLHRVSWKSGSDEITRETFASHPDDVIVIHYRSTGTLSGKVRLAGAHGESTSAESGRLSFSGTLSNKLRYAAQMSATADGGSLAAADGALLFKDTKALTLVLSAGTDYAMDPAKKFRSGLDPVKTVAERSKLALARKYDDLRSRHTADFSPRMGRLAFDLGAPKEGDTKARLEAYKKGAEDPALEALMFQYGRYMLASSSRDSLPANLQGLWNDSNKPAWFADYHTNINIQMNYWQAEPANLAEESLRCQDPGLDDADLRESLWRQWLGLEPAIVGVAGAPLLGILRLHR